MVYLLLNKGNKFISNGKTNYKRLTKFLNDWLKRDLFAGDSGTQFQDLSESQVISGVKSQLVIYEKNSSQKQFKKHFLWLSISHKKEYFALAFSLKFRVGIDLELLDEKKNIHKIAKRYFSSEENRALRVDKRANIANKLNKHKPIQDPLTKFYEFWTKKEALYKLISSSNEARKTLEPEKFILLLKKDLAQYEKEYFFQSVLRSVVKKSVVKLAECKSDKLILTWVVRLGKAMDQGTDEEVKVKWLEEKI